MEKIKFRESAKCIRIKNVLKKRLVPFISEELVLRDATDSLDSVSTTNIYARALHEKCSASEEWEKWGPL